MPSSEWGGEFLQPFGVVLEAATGVRSAPASRHCARKLLGTHKQAVLETSSAEKSTLLMEYASMKQRRRLFTQKSSLVITNPLSEIGEGREPIVMPKAVY